jgi:hypothetical protein
MHQILRNADEQTKSTGTKLKLFCWFVGCMMIYTQTNISRHSLIHNVISISLACNTVPENQAWAVDSEREAMCDYIPTNCFSDIFAEGASSVLLQFSWCFPGTVPGLWLSGICSWPARNSTGPYAVIKEK